VVTNGGDTSAYDHADWAGARFQCGSTDTTNPSATVTAPNNGATVSGTTTTATATDNVAVAGVQFKLDGTNIGAEDTTSPYSISWDTTTASNGNHTITAVARDTSNNTGTSTGITVTVSNQAPPPPPNARYLSDLTSTFESNGFGPIE